MCIFFRLQKPHFKHYSRFEVLIARNLEIKAVRLIFEKRSQKPAKLQDLVYLLGCNTS